MATERTVNFEPLFRAWRCSGSAPTNPTIVTEIRHFVFTFYFLPRFLLGHDRKRGCVESEASGCIVGGNPMW